MNKKILFFNSITNFNNSKACKPLYDNLKLNVTDNISTLDILLENLNNKLEILNELYTNESPRINKKIIAQKWLLTILPKFNYKNLYKELVSINLNSPNNLATDIKYIIVKNEAGLPNELRSLYTNFIIFIKDFTGFVIPGSSEEINEFFYNKDVNLNKYLENKSDNCEFIIHDLFCIFIYCFAVKNNLAYLGICQGCELMYICNNGVLEKAEQVIDQTVTEIFKFKINNKWYESIVEQTYKHRFYMKLNKFKNINLHPLNHKAINCIYDNKQLGVLYHPELNSQSDSNLPLTAFAANL